MEIMREGGGIGFTVEQTRLATDEELLASLVARLKRMLCGGKIRDCYIVDDFLMRDQVRHMWNARQVMVWNGLMNYDYCNFSRKLVRLFQLEFPSLIVQLMPFQSRRKTTRINILLLPIEIKQRKR